MKVKHTKTDEEIKGTVRQRYGDIARRFVEEPEQASCCDPSQPAASCCEPVQAAGSSCCDPTEATITDIAKFYSAEEVADLPDSVTDISLGCGNPIAISELQPGEVVLDLGSGGGIDCFIAAKQVGPEGKVIGLDMTPDMIKLARRNAKTIGAMNVEFRYGEMEEMPLPDASVDAIISNCVINLSPDKDAVFAEAFRVLRPGGRMNVSDIVLNGELPQPIRDSLDAWAGCVAGALDESDYLNKIQAAGFREIEVLSRDYVKASEFAEWGEIKSILGDDIDLTAEQLDHTVASVKVRARKAV